ncbi:MAG: GreA/GreB family elongation factor [bacterium]|nr:GreA/GreB family elongation factor [bacterium]
MTQENGVILTRAGYEQLERELADFESRRARQQEEIDLIQTDMDEQFPEEGAEFEARIMTDYLDERIGHLRRILEDAQVIDQDPDAHTVDPGDRVTVWDVRDRTEYIYDLIGGAEAMYGRDGVSIDSPIGQALIGRHVGDVIDVETPEGPVRWAIRQIERTPND